MTRRQQYFLKQKLIGVGYILLPIILAIVTTLGECLVMGFFTWPMGLLMIFTKEMVWEDDYYFEVSEYGFEDDEEL